MTISYNWLHEYLPVTIDPERLSKLLTSVGLEVESLERYESLKGGLQGLVIGEVLATEKHPNADKLTVTKVNIGLGDPLQIVCGAPNVAAGQKVVVATVGTTIYPKKGDPLTMKIAKIRGVESYGMICAEDEIGLSDDHAGIIVLPAEIKVGIAAADYFKIYTDWIYEIGLTPNRMDAMSHRGVARDVCAYLSYHDNQDLKVKALATDNFKVENTSLPIAVTIENTNACQRYSGVSISGVTVKESPQWLQDKLRAIGQRPINNIVDITNFVLHETGQPLHAFDADKITGKKVEQVLQEEVIQPIGLYHTFFSRNDSLRRMVAEGHIDMMPNYDELPESPGMAYSMHTEAKIFTRFMLYLLEQKGLSAQTYETMFRKHSDYNYDPGEEKPKIPTYMGESLEIRETPFGKSFGHGGNNGDFKCKFEVYKDAKMGYVIFTNSNTSDVLLGAIRQFLVEGKEK